MSDEELSDEDREWMDAPLGPPRRLSIASQLGAIYDNALISARAAAYTWPLPNGREIEIRVNDGALSKGDLSFLRRYLEVVEDTLQDGQPLSVGSANDDEVDEGAL